MPPADHIQRWDPGQWANKDQLDPANDFSSHWTVTANIAVKYQRFHSRKVNHHRHSSWRTQRWCHLPVRDTCQHWQHQPLYNIRVRSTCFTSPQLLVQFLVWGSVILCHDVVGTQHRCMSTYPRLLSARERRRSRRSTRRLSSARSR